MGLLDSLKNFFKTEAAEAKDMLDDVTGAAERSIDAKQRELDATPEERMAMLEDQMADSDDALEQIRQKVEGTLAKPEAEAELAESIIEDAQIVEPERPDDNA